MSLSPPSLDRSSASNTPTPTTTTTPTPNHGSGTSPHRPIAVLLSASAPGNPSGLGSENQRLLPGQRLELGVTVTNQGDQDAILDIFIDEHQPILRSWCPVPQKRLALPPNQTGEIGFVFEIPPTTSPGNYSYDLVVDAHSAYPDLPPLRLRNRQIQILVPDQTHQHHSPSLGLQPHTTPTTPLVLQPGEPALLQLQVENRSERVDRFRVIGSGLAYGWRSKVIYPSLMTGTGVVVEADSLGLNPGDRGMIQVQITPPIQALAGPYVPTLRLHSANQPELNLLELVYLQVAPTDFLQAQIQPLQPTVRGGAPARFELQVLNGGNRDRWVEVAVRGLDDQGVCLYRLEPRRVEIQPQAVAQMVLEGQPQQPWRRPWWGPGRVFSFQVEIRDRQGLPVPTPTLPGYFTWAARARWQLLLAAIAALGGMGCIVWLLWLLLRPAPLPQILDFGSDDSQYFAATQDSARVHWQIQEIQNVRSLEISGYGPEGQRLSGPLVYDLRQGLPTALQSVCRRQANTLSCRNVRTDARQPGQYQFELSLTPRRRSSPISRQAKPVTIHPLPRPQVEEFSPRQVVYQEVTPGGGGAAELPAVPPEGIGLNWVIRAPQYLDALKLVGRDDTGKILGQIWFEFRDENGDGRRDVPAALARHCRLEEVLLCQNVPTGVTQPGSYQFDLTALATGEEETQLKPTTSEMIQIQPQTAQITGFHINGEEAQAKYLVPLSPGQPAPTVLLSWQVVGGVQTRVELQPSPGTVPLVGQMALPLNQTYGATTIALQVTDGLGKVSRRAVTLETFDPAPVDPVATANAAIALSSRVAQESQARTLTAIAQLNQQAAQQQAAQQVAQQAAQQAAQHQGDRPSPGLFPPAGSSSLSPAESSPSLR